MVLTKYGLGIRKKGSDDSETARGATPFPPLCHLWPGLANKGRLKPMRARKAVMKRVSVDRNQSAMSWQLRSWKISTSRFAAEPLHHSVSEPPGLEIRQC